MAEEPNDGVAYLRALRQMTTSDAAAGAAPAKDTGATDTSSASAPSAPFQGAEKRRSPRYKC